MDDIAYLRRGATTLLRNALAKGGIADEGAALQLAQRLEEACARAAAEGLGRSAGLDKQRYVQIYGGLSEALPKGYGEFLEATLAAQVADGRVPAEEAAAARVYEAHKCIDERKTIRALFYGLLAKDPRFDDPTRRDYAVRIEKGCYNAAIARCADSAEAYQRQWTSPMFVNVYSARCGLVAANIDPGGRIVQGVQGGAWALDRLATQAWAPEALGGMTESELCPEAGKAERAEVLLRLDQKVDEKTSTLFACPKCHKRNHTYRLVQIGGADEPSTFMCTCKECGTNYEGRG